MATPSREKVANDVIVHNYKNPRSKSVNRLIKEKQRENGWDTSLQDSGVSFGKMRDTVRVSTRQRDTNTNRGSHEPLNVDGEIVPKVRKTKVRPRKSPPNGKLDPLPLSQPLIKGESKSDALRKKAVELIEYREGVIRQLVTFIECFPLKTSSQHSPSSSRVTCKFEGERTHPQLTSHMKPNDIQTVLKQLSAELQIAGIRCVESIVAWMLSLAKKTEKPPVFIWKKENYFVRMYSDLDGLAGMLQCRSIQVPPEFTNSNPLLIESNQRLGRVCAAHSIILEMVEWVNINTPASFSTHMTTTGLSANVAPSRIIPVIDQKSPDNAKESVKRDINEPEVHTTSSTLFTNEPRGIDLQNFEEEFDYFPFASDSKISGADTTALNSENQNSLAFNAESLMLSTIESTTDSNNYETLNEKSNAELGDNPVDWDHNQYQTESSPVPSADNENVRSHEVSVAHETKSKIFEVASENVSCNCKRHEHIRDHLSQLEIPKQQLATLIECVETRQVEMVIQVLHENPCIPLSNIMNLLCENYAIIDDIVRYNVSIVDKAIKPLLVSVHDHMQSNSSSLKEIDLEDLLDQMTLVVESREPNTIISTALQVSKCIHSKLTSSTFTSQLSSDLFRSLYPFIMNSSQKSISDNCGKLFSILSPLVDFVRYPFFLDSLGKGILLLNLAGNKPELNTKNFPKANVVCDRAKPLESTMFEIEFSHAWSTPSHLYPYFLSEYGENIVNGSRVEAGEGRGPLKEWFSIISRELSSPWVLQSQAIPSKTPLHILGNKVSGSRIVPQFDLKVGCRLDVDILNDGTRSCVITRILNDDEVLLDGQLSSEEAIIDAHYKWYGMRTPVLVYIKESECYWINEYTKQNSRKYLELLGWLMAISILHQIHMDCRLHVVLFQLLLGERFDVHSIELLDNSLYQSWKKLNAMDNFEAFLQMEELPLNMSVDEYIEHVVQVKWDNLSWQLSSIREGFSRLLPLTELQECMILDYNFQSLVCGSVPREDFNIRDIFLVSMDEEFAQCQYLHDAVWYILDNLSPSDKRRFVKFVTGVDKLPVPGTEILRIELPYTVISASERAKQLLVLPQAHTCDNVLDLPNYWTALCEKFRDSSPTYDMLVQIVKEKLMYAIENGNNYGLDVVSSIATNDGGLRSHQHQVNFPKSPHGAPYNFPNEEINDNHILDSSSTDQLNDIPSIDWACANNVEAENADSLNEMSIQENNTYQVANSSRRIISALSRDEAEDDEYSFDDFEQL
ncbi:hypothetical protein AC1031_013294 [Aphanomyces cochlioides]|nr:hypothetical protein AC1031_013294 [Aphanomyces cochlioides]